ncbi:hypothetical protein [Bacteroides sp.]|uniref:hypothetical protein n=1 Tax=Bacteroides sp. TaxID=29523 RepID=UPI002FC771A8
MAQQSTTESSSMIRLYPYGVNPEEYPDYTRRPFTTPSWNTFEHKVQFVGGRGWGKEFGVIEETPPYWIAKGRVIRPNFSHFLMEPGALRQTLNRLKQGGYYLFNINAFGPGTPPQGNFGQFRVERWKVDMMKEVLGDRYLGFDLGEQDGRYWADCRSIDYPMSDNKSQRYIRAMKYMQKAAREQGDIISMLSVKWFWHYPIKEGFITCAGAESQNKTYTSNDQIHYAFIRGASKQYGLLWYGDISVFNTWGYKSYQHNTQNSNPQKGNSLAWMKRMLLSQYQYNSAILGFEGSVYQGKPKQERLSPIGQMQTDMQTFVEKHPNPGPQYTPIALMLDFFSGWMTPNEPFKDRYKVWGFLPYQTGDFLTHQLLKMFYQDYDQSGLHKNEYAGLCNTPYGDALDVLLSDANVSALNRYAMVVIGGELSTNTAEVADRLTRYMNQGGKVIITIGNAQKLFPQTVSPLSGTSFKVMHYPIQKGQLSVFHGTKMGILPNKQMDTQLQTYLDSVFKSTRLFSVGNSLGYVTNIEGNGTYLLGIYNHSLTPQSFNIQCHAGNIRNIEELYPIRDLSKEAGYFPEGFEKQSSGAPGSSIITAADARLFRITVDEDTQQVTYLPKVTVEKRIYNHFLSVSSLIGLSEHLQSMPTFFDHFSGVKINWTAATDIDHFAFSEDAWWYNLKQLEFLITFDQNFEDALQRDTKLLSKLVNTLKASKHISYLLVPSTLSNNTREAIGKTFAPYTTARIIHTPEQAECIVLEVPYQSWEELYPSVLKMEQKQPLSPPLPTLSKELIGKVAPANKTYYFSYHENKKSLIEELASNPLYFSHFGGVKIDATYLSSRDIELCKAEAESIQATGMELIVDFTREINNYPDITFLEELTHSYTRSVYIYRRVFEKMKAAGIQQVIIGSHMRPEMWQKEFGRTPEESILNGMSAFIYLANEYGITVFLQNSTYRFYPSKLVAKPTETLEAYYSLYSSSSRLKLAANLGFGDAPNQLINLFSNNLGACIFASPGADDRDYPVAFAHSKNKETFTIHQNILKILDADYRSLNELISDKQLIATKHVNYL